MSCFWLLAPRCRYLPLLAALTIFCTGVDAEWSGRNEFPRLLIDDVQTLRTAIGHENNAGAFVRRSDSLSVAPAVLGTLGEA